MKLLTILILAVVMAAVSVEGALRLGLPWGTDNQWAKNMAKGNIKWYHHWQMGAVSEIPSSIQYVPMYWGPRYNSLWADRKKEITKFKSTRILAFNEPDVAGQANMSPGDAATLFMKELQPYRNQGIKVSSPQIVYNVEWMDSFLKKLRAKGGDVDFMAVHWYGSYKDLASLKKWMTRINKRYGKSVWLTEYGVTAASQPSAADLKSFHIRATQWLKTQDYVKRAAWLGCFAIDNPPDDYAARMNAFFNSGGSLRAIANWYVHAASARRSITEEGGVVAPAARTPGGSRHNSARSHRAIMEEQEAELIRAVEEEDDDDEIVYDPNEPEEHCDEICKARNESLDHAPDDDDELAEGQVGDEANYVD